MNWFNAIVLSFLAIWQQVGTVDYLAKVPVIEVFNQTPEITLLAVGDIMLDRGVEAMVNKVGDKDFNFIFSQIADLKNGSDILLGNLEGPVAIGGHEIGNLYSFHMNPAVLPALKKVGFDVFNVANNHAGDWGRQALIETLDNLTQNNLTYVGGGLLARATEPVIFEKNGLKIGFLGFSDVGPSGLKPTDEQIGILNVDADNFSTIISQATKKVDTLIVTIHWGDEYQTIHNRRQASLAHQAVDAGAKVVIGHHPHVIQDMEEYKNGYIAYSLGNFVFDQPFSTATMQGLALKLKINKDGVASAEKKLVKLNKYFQPSFAN